MKHRILVGLLALVVFTPFLGSVRLFDWDEVNFAECAREMIETGDYMHVRVDYEPFYEKPPLFIWAQVVSMKMFGINEFGARFPNAVIGAITLVIIFSIGQNRHNTRFGYLWALVYAGSLLPHFYFRSGIIDPMFNLFIFLGVISMMRSMRGNQIRNALVAGGWCAAAVMTKGPVGFGLVMLTTGVFWLTQIKSLSIPWRQVLVASGVTVVLSSLWFLIDYIQNGPTFVAENLAYQVRLLTSGEAGHEQPFWYHFVVVLIGCFPASFLMFGGVKASPDEADDQATLRKWMIILLCVVLFVFSVVKTKIIHYSSMTYLPLTFLATVYLDRWISRTASWSWINTATTTFFGVFWALAIGAVSWAFMDRDWLLSLPTFRDVFLRSAIMRDVAWTGLEPYVGVALILGVVAAWWYRRMDNRVASIGALFGSVIVFVSLVLPLIAPKIEPYTQGSALDFYEEHAGQDVYIKPLTMKSYAHLFYQKKPEHLSAQFNGYSKDEWEPHLMNDVLDKPAFFVSKVNDAGRWRDDDRLVELYEEGGFVFFRRK